jgi:hypothetical protein
MPIPKAMNLPNNPASSDSEPSDSAIITRNAKTAGIPVEVKYAIVAVKPFPPNNPSSFCKPWGMKTTASTNLAKKTPASLEVDIKLAIAFFMILPPQQLYIWKQKKSKIARLRKKQGPLFPREHEKPVQAIKSSQNIVKSPWQVYTVIYL